MLSKLRTIKQSLEEIKKLDPETAITEWLIRDLCKKKKILFYISGNKKLVNIDSLLNYFEGACYEQE